MKGNHLWDGSQETFQFSFLAYLSHQQVMGKEAVERQSGTRCFLLAGKPEDLIFVDLRGEGAGVKQEPLILGAHVSLTPVKKRTGCYPFHTHRSCFVSVVPQNATCIHCAHHLSNHVIPLVVGNKPELISADPNNMVVISKPLIQRQTEGF